MKEIACVVPVFRTAWEPTLAGLAENSNLKTLLLLIIIIVRDLKSK